MPQRALGDRVHFVNRRRQRLHYVVHNAQTAQPKGIVIIVHGFGHHVEACIPNYKPERFTAAGYIVTGFSFHGHGYSDGRWVHVRRYENLVDDLADFFQLVRTQHSQDLPIFLIGESMGGAVVLLATRPGAALHGKVNGCIFMAPMCAIAPEMTPPQWQINMLRLLMTMMPIAAITPVEPVLNRVFKDPQRLEQELQDKLCWHKKPRLRTAWEMREATLDVQSQLAQYDVPFLVLHGGADTVTDPKISGQLHQHASSKDKTIKVYDGMYHALLAEPDGGDELVHADIMAWIQDRLQSQEKPAEAPAINVDMALV
eukprot:m.82570 g.82570  ORF g.82570 m.82570 type:complete len:314 (+) comp14304_c0_seq1:97-1038(+)